MSEEQNAVLESITVSYEGEEEPQPEFIVTITDTNSPVPQGQTLVVDADIENTGDEDGTQDITLAFDTDDNIVDTEENFEVLQGETESVTLEYGIDSEKEVGDYDVWVASEDSDDTSIVTVEEADEAVEISVDRPADGAEARSTNVRFVFDVEVTSEGVGEDYFVHIIVDEEKVFTDEINDASEQIYSYDELVEDLETGTRERKIRVEKQED